MVSYIFYRYESGVEDPLFDLRLFKNRNFAWNGSTTFISYVAAYPIVFLLSLYLQYFQGLTPEKTGAILAIQPILVALVSPLAGRLSDKGDPSIVAMTGIIAIIIAMLVFSSLGSIQGVIFGLILLGMGFGFFSTPNTKLVMDAVERRFFGVASATLGTLRVLGQLTGMSFILFLINIYLKGGSIEANMDLFQFLMSISFILFIFFLLLGLILTLRSK